MNMIANHFIKNKEALRYRSTWFDIFGVDTVWPVCFQQGNMYLSNNPDALFPGRLVKLTGNDNFLFPVVSVSEDGKVDIDTTVSIPVPQPGKQLLPAEEIITIKKGDLANTGDKEERDTPFGTFFINYYLFADIFGSSIPYLNDVWDSGIDTLIVEHALAGDITVDQLHTYANRIYAIGHTSELVTPSLTEACLSVGTTIKAKRKEILDKYRSRIQAGDAGAMVAAEQEVAKAIKEALAGDPSLRFLLSGKNINVQLLKMAGLGGSSESLTQPGKFAFIEESLMDDRKLSSFPAVANETRGASISRALETAKGGEDSKYLIRMFQNVRITMDDCGSNMYLYVLMNKDVRRMFSYRVALINNKLTTLTRNVMNSIPDGTVLKIRSPMYCKCKNGFCFTCVSMVMKRLSKSSVTMAKLALGSFFLTLALKAMHGSSRENIPVNLEDFTVDIAFIP